MLVLARRVDESIIIDGNIEVTVLEVSGGQVRLGITAPQHHRVYRKELFLEMQAENQPASRSPEALRALESLLGDGAEPVAAKR